MHSRLSDFPFDRTHHHPSNDQSLQYVYFEVQRYHRGRQGWYWDDQGDPGRSAFEHELLLTETQFNRPNALNSLGGSMVTDTISALRELDNHPDTVFTVITGEGRFFCAGADVSSTPCSKRSAL